MKRRVDVEYEENLHREEGLTSQEGNDRDSRNEECKSATVEDVDDWR